MFMILLKNLARKVLSISCEIARKGMPPDLADK